jgi:hypothetical protein
MASNTEVLTFVHQFSPSLIATARILNQPPASGQQPAIETSWIGRPRAKDLPEYKRWMLGVNQSLAERWNIKVLYAAGVSPHKTEFWIIEPGSAPKLVEAVPMGIPVI